MILAASAATFTLALTLGAEQVKLLTNKTGLWPGLGLFSLLFLLALLAPPLWLSRKIGGGASFLLFCWNLAWLGAAAGLAPVGAWFTDRGAQVPALVLGAENTLVKTVLIDYLEWGLGSDGTAQPNDKTPTPKPTQKPQRELPVGANDRFDLNLYEELVREGDRATVERYVTRFPEAFASELDSSPAGLRVAVRKGNLDLVKYLLESGVDASAAEGLLIDAARISPKDPRKNAMVRLLLGNNVNPNETTDEGSALHFIENERLAGAVISAGTRLDHVDRRGRTALHKLVEQDRPHCAKLLLDGGAKVNALDNNSRTPLYYAGNNPRVVALLLSSRADVYQIDKNGKTAQDYIEDELTELKGRSEHKDEADEILTKFKISQHEKSIKLMNRPKDARKIVEGFEEGPVRRYSSLDESYSATFPAEPRQHPYEMVSSVTVAGGRFSIGAKEFTTPEDKKKAESEMEKRPDDKAHREFQVNGFPAVRVLRGERMSQFVWVQDTLYLAVASHASVDDMNLFLDSFQLHPAKFKQ